jgi:C1A family cysteine protease
MKSLISCVLSLCFFSVMSAAGELTLEPVQRAIAESGAHWTASDSWLRGLQGVDPSDLCGAWARDRDPSPRGEPWHARSSLPPAALDWRDYEGENWVTSVRDQAACGACWAFGALGALESRIRIDWDAPQLQIDLSEQYLLACSSGSCNGWGLNAVHFYLQSYGTADEDCFPYEAVDTTPCEDRCSDWQQRMRQIGTYGELPEGNVEAIKQAIVEGPVEAAMSVFEDFFYYESGIYEHVSGGYSGGHAVALIGWNDADQCWIAKNSWGPSWGEQGFFRIRWGEADIESWVVWGQPAASSYPYLRITMSFADDTSGDDDGVLNAGEDGLIWVEVANDASWADASDVQGTLATTEYGVVVLDSLGAFGSIAGGSAATNQADPFAVRVDEAIGDSVSFVLSLRANQGGAYSYDVTRVFAVPVAPLQMGWPVTVTGDVYNSPALPAGGRVICGGSDGWVHAWDAFGTYIPGFPTKVGGSVRGAVAMGDLVDDQADELVVASSDSSVYVISGQGAILLRQPLGDQVPATPALGDLDGDGSLEVVVGTRNGELFAFDPDGTLLNGFPLDVGGIVNYGAAVGDFDDDGCDDVAVAGFGGVLHVVDGGGLELPGWPQVLPSRPGGGVVAGRLVPGGAPAIVVPGWDGSVYLYDAGGTMTGLYPLGGSLRTTPALVDLDGDGDLEILVGDVAGNVHALHHDGALVGGSWPVEIGGLQDCGPVAADLDGDGSPEIVITSNGGEVTVTRSDGSVLPGYPFSVGSAVRASASVGDLDSDGDLEIAVGSQGAVWVWDHKTSGGSVGDWWPTHRRTALREGFLPNEAHAAGDPAVAAPRGMVLDLIGNPVTREAGFRLWLPAPSRADLTLYRADGRMVVRESRLFAEGWHDVRVPVASLPPGLYVGRLTAGSAAAQQRLVVVR